MGIATFQIIITLLDFASSPMPKMFMTVKRAMSITDTMMPIPVRTVTPAVVSVRNGK